MVHAQINRKEIGLSVLLDISGVWEWGRWGGGGGGSNWTTGPDSTVKAEPTTVRS